MYGQPYQLDSCAYRRRCLSRSPIQLRELTVQSGAPQASNPSIRFETAPSQWPSRVFHACANFLGMIAVAIAGAINHTSSSPATEVANESKSTPSCSPSEIKNLTQFFRYQREQLAADSPAYDEIHDGPSLTSDSLCFGDLSGINSCPVLFGRSATKAPKPMRDYQDIY